MNLAKIAIIEDNNEYRTYLEHSLKSKFEVAAFASANDARAYLQNHRVDSILLDIGLSEEDGFTFCSDLKKNFQTKDVPVLFLTSKENIEDKLTGFSLGADDYIVKPIHPLELVARIERLQRRKKVENQPASILSLHGIRIDFDAIKVFIEEGGDLIELHLTPTEFKILSFLMKNENRVVSREQILTSVWGEKTHVVDRAIDTHIHTLRKKLGTKADMIQSVFGEGYQFAYSPQ